MPCWRRWRGRRDGGRPCWRSLTCPLGERIVLGGEPLDDDGFAALAGEVLAVADRAPPGEHPYQFEMLTAMGFLAAAGGGAECVVCEVGMGGRLDSTNVADLGGCAITNIALDHREWLGDTVEAIAAEKAGIVKAGDWAASAATDPARSIIAERARTVGAELESSRPAGIGGGPAAGGQGSRSRSRWASPAGASLRPAPSMRVAADRRGADREPGRRRDGRGQARDPGAGDRRRGRRGTVAGTAPVAGWHAPLLLDGAHNPAALTALGPEVAELAGDRRVVALFGAMADKQLDAHAPAGRGDGPGAGPDQRRR